jgi:hypothetical protein
MGIFLFISSAAFLYFRGHDQAVPLAQELLWGK